MCLVEKLNISKKALKRHKIDEHWPRRSCCPLLLSDDLPKSREQFYECLPRSCQETADMPPAASPCSDPALWPDTETNKFAFHINVLHWQEEVRWATHWSKKSWNNQLHRSLQMCVQVHGQPLAGHWSTLPPIPNAATNLTNVILNSVYLANHHSILKKHSSKQFAQYFLLIIGAFRLLTYCEWQ